MMYAAGATWAAKPKLLPDAAISYIGFDETKINRTAVTATISTYNLRGDVTGSAGVMSSDVRSGNRPVNRGLSWPFAGLRVGRQP